MCNFAPKYNDNGMKYAIIAAGEGSRLAAEGVTDPKPLITINGEMMIDRLIRIFMQNDAEEIVVICNSQAPQVARHLEDLQHNGLCGLPLPLRFIVKSTPSSMHSFAALSPFLSGSRFILTTVDTIFREDEFAAFVETFRQSPQSLFPVTAYSDDECPLWVAVDDSLRITGFHDTPCHSAYVSAGIYGLLPDALTTLKGCLGRRESRMRNFQRALIADGHPITAFPMSEVFDVDHVSDIRKASSFLQS